MKLTLGTVQFGLDYGVSNSAGRTPPEEVRRILAAARSAGIDALDTAAAYGQSEAVLGEIGVENWHVVSKVPPWRDSAGDGGRWVDSHLRRSLDRLGRQRLDALLLHRAEDILKPGGDAIVAALRQARDDGRVGRIGYSIYAPDQLPALLAAMPPDLVQAPLNVLDQRLLASGWLDRLHDVGIEVHTRSAFLQGLLLMAPAARPPAFARWRERWRAWDACVAGHGGSAPAACLGFLKACPGIGRIVIGVDHTAHLEQLLAAWAAAVPVDAAALACTDTQLIDPSKWGLK